MPNGDKPDLSQLPPVGAVDFELSALIRTLEELFPGFTNRWIENLEEEAAADEVIRLRGPRQAPAVLQEHNKARARAAQVRLVNIALMRDARSWDPPDKSKSKSKDKGRRA